MKNTKRQEKGITLIALVITIIVLLILAGVTIAMLSGENGILSRATETRSTNAEAQADEQAKLAYMGVRTEIIAEKVTNASYNPALADNTTTLGEKVENDLDPKKEKKTWTVNYGTPGTITMTYTDSSLKNTKNTANNHTIVYTIKLPGAGETTVTLKKDNVDMASGESGSASTVVFKSGETTVTEPAVGNDVEIGNEKFKVIKITGNKVTAMPYYNLDLTLTGTSIKQQTSSSNPNSSEQKIAFSSVNPPTWNANENIDLDKNENNVKILIANYQAYLRGLGANNVTAKIGRKYQPSQGSAVIDESEYIGNLSNLNPSGKGYFWIGSTDDIMGANDVHIVFSNGSIINGGIPSLNYYGVRPLIIIDL